MDPLLVVLLVLAVAAVVWVVATRVRPPTVATPPAAAPATDPVVQAQLGQLTEAVQRLGQHTAQQFGQVGQSLRNQAEVSQQLYSATHDLREALANTNARGQWGERMAEDVLRTAGLLPDINYTKRTAVAGDARVIPDFTFLLPDSHVLFMDVKFPIDGYLAYQRATSELEAAQAKDAFLKAVRGHVRELARRDYAKVDDRPAIDNVLMFVPNETIVGFIHEHAPTLVDDALRDRVILCSPLTLFAFLGVIRQAFDNFRLEQTSREVLVLLGQFEVQFGRYATQVEKVKRQFDTLVGSMDELVGTRRRQLEKPLRDIETLRRSRGIDVPGSVPLELADGTVEQLGA
jgi:DNA recombination protein RmuC